MQTLGLLFPSLCPLLQGVGLVNLTQMTVKWGLPPHGTHMLSVVVDVSATHNIGPLLSWSLYYLCEASVFWKDGQYICHCQWVIHLLLVSVPSHGQLECVHCLFLSPVLSFLPSFSFLPSAVVRLPYPKAELPQSALFSRLSARLPLSH